MGTTYNNAPVYKETNYPTSEFTFDNYKALMEMNKEIVNNKQGDLGVEIMSMKDFYNAGGYSFLEDYRAELGALDAAYDRALPGYGVKGEQMAQAGMTGSGYGDYLSGQAYALRASGQAVARQNIMANNKAFQSDYNKYLTQQNDKREQNLQKMIEVAYNSAMDPEMFVEVATKRGISKADAERGKSILEGYYMGFGAPASVKEQMQTLANNAYNLNLSGDAFKEYAKAFGLTNESYLTQAESMLNALYAGTVRNEYGLTEEEQTQASSLVQQIIQGAGTYADTGAIKNMFVGISSSKNAEAIYNAALQQAKEGVLAELQGVFSRGEYIPTDELAKLKKYYGFTDAEFEGITTGMKEMEDSGNIKLNTEQQMQASSYADLFNTALSDAIENNTAFSLKTILSVNHLDESDPLVKAAIDDFQSIQAGAYEEQLAQGAFVSKKALDTAKSSRLISETQYNDLLGKAQEKTGEKLIEAIMNGYADDEIAALEYLGVDVSSVGENNCENLLIEAVEEAYQNGDITKAQKKSFDEARWQNDISMIQDLKDLEKTILTIKQQKGTIEETAKCFNITGVSYGKYNHKNGFDINLYTESGTKITVPVLLNLNAPMEVKKKISAEIESAVGENHDNVVQYKGTLYTKKNGYWYSLKIDDGKDPIEANNSKSPIKDWLYQFFDAEAQKQRNQKTANALRNTLSVVKK